MAARSVGLLGGTFDPVHVGHLVVAEAARELLGLDELRLLVAGSPWMKGTVTAAPLRVAMAEAAVADNPSLVVDARETHRDGPTHTVTTLRELRVAEPDVAWTFLLGTDAAARLAGWHEAAALPGLADFVAITRPGHPVPDLPAWVRLLEVPALQVSSTEVRRLIGQGRSVRYLVPESVRTLLREHGLYGPADGPPRP